MHDLAYEVVVRLESVDRLILWIQGTFDTVLLNPDGRIAFCRDHAEILSRAKEAGLGLSQEPPTVIDLDSVSDWVACPRWESMEPSILLDAWNMVGDVAATVGTQADCGADADFLYEKLLFTCGVPALGSERVAPDDWTDSELDELAATLRGALFLFNSLL